MEDTRRTTLLGIGGLLVGTAVAGCTSGDNDNGSEEPEEPEPEYNAELTLDRTEIDLTDLPVGRLGEFSDIRDEDHISLEYTVEKHLANEKSPVEPDQAKLKIRDKYGQTSEKQLETERYQLACTELGDEENQVILQATVGDETVEASRTVTKRIPREYEAEIIADGETIGEYSSPYRFDNIDFTTEEFQELRNQHIQDERWHEIVNPTLENNNVDFRPEVDPSDIWRNYSHEGSEWNTTHFQELGIDNLEKIINDTGLAFHMKYVNNKGGASGISGDMNHKLSTTMTLVDRHINDIPRHENRYDHSREIDLEGGHISSIGHGNALYFEKNTEKWINYDPDGGVVSEPSKAPDVDREDRFYPPVEYMLGKPDNHEALGAYRAKKQLGIRTIASTHSISSLSSNVSTQDINADDKWLKRNLRKIGENRPLGKTADKLLKASQVQSHRTEKNSAIFGGDNGENRLLITDNGATIYRFRNDPDPVTTEEVQNQILN